MNRQIKSLIAGLLILCFTNKTLAQDIVIDLKNQTTNYSTNLLNNFKVSFKGMGKGEKAKIILKTADVKPTVLQEQLVDLNGYSMDFTTSSDGLSVKDSKGQEKSIKIANEKFEIDVNDKAFTISDANDVIVDLTSLKKDFVADYKKGFKITFKSADKTAKTVSIETGEGDNKKTATLKKSVNPNTYKPDFSFKDGKLFVRDEKGNDVAIDSSPFTIKVGDKSFTITNTPSTNNNSQARRIEKQTCSSIEIIDKTMVGNVSQAGGCLLCDVRSIGIPIASKKDRVYTTDYIIIYDPLIKKDAYTICKHVFQNIKKGDRSKYGDTMKLLERYIKVGPKWFAPHVGSEILFEVVNQPLTTTLKLVVDEQDVFNGGASQFASIINNLVNANIVTPLSGTTKSSTSIDTTAKATGAKDDSCFLAHLNAVATQILNYMSAFKLSSCAIEQHNLNLPIILSKINQAFQLNSVNAEQLGTQLTQKIDEVVKDENKIKAVKEVETIINALKALENIKPIAYTTLRAKNRDYIEVKYSDVNNVLSKPENIRMSGGMKIDFSAGFILTGLRDYSYVLKNDTVHYTPPGSTTERDTTGNVIVKEDDGNNQIGVCLLTHFYPRSSSHYNIGGTAGLMTSTNLNLRLMLGGSLMISSLFGSNNRISFSGGIVWGKVKRLSVRDEDFYNHPRSVNKIPEFYSQASAPTPIDKNDHSWFFAITLNFGGN